jgi:predicted RNA methylase
MGRISKVVQKKHKEAMDLVYSDKKLSAEDRFFVFEHYHEGASNLNGLAGAFFTPYGLAKELAIEVQGKRIIDLCAGIGMLGFVVTNGRQEYLDLTCIEINTEYCEVGKRLVPWAKWYCKDVTEINALNNKFDVAISNPPFGNLNGKSMFELEVVRIASTVAKTGVFLLPQESTPFRFSGQQNYEEKVTDKVQKWMDDTKIELDFNCGIDTSSYKNEWKGVKPTVEIICAEFE